MKKLALRVAVNETVIHVEHLVKDFGHHTVINDVSFSVKRGSIVGLLGPNGAGKTTILKILSCHLSPTAGTVSVEGAQWEMESLEFKRRIGFLTREMNLYDLLTVRENLIFFGSLNQIPERRLEEKISDLSIRLDLNPFLDKKYRLLSTGQKQRANIANTLLHEPSVLLLDEITASLDILSCRELLEAIRQEAENGTSVVYSTHIMSEAEYLCDQILLVNEGTIIAQGTPLSLKEQFKCRNLTDVFFRAVDLARRPR